MIDLENNVKKFCAVKGIAVIRERDVQYGKQLTLELDGDTVNLISYPKTGNCLVQGKASRLKEMIQALSTTSLPYSSSHYVDLPSEWSEWNLEARWISEFHKTKGIPKDTDLNHRYMINREVLFHDYMFRSASHIWITFELFESLVRSWFRRNCFMNIDINDMIENMRKSMAEGNLGSTLSNLSFAEAAYLLSNEMACHCPVRYIKSKHGNNGCCPQTEKEYSDCLVDIMDALYPYYVHSVLSYTKGNLEKLLTNRSDLKWKSIRSSTPIEEKMEKALLDAGILSLPQYQAWDQNHRYTIDFVVKTPQGQNIAIECDGLQYHANPKTYVHDRKRDRYLQDKGFYMMRFSSVEIFNEIENVIEEIDKSYWKIQKKILDTRTPFRISYFGYGEED